VVHLRTCPRSRRARKTHLRSGKWPVFDSTCGFACPQVSDVLCRVLPCPESGKTRHHRL
jgi:hypothetical protein